MTGTIQRPRARIVLLTSLALAASLATAGQGKELKPRPDGYFYVTDATGSFDERLDQCIKASLAETPGQINVNIPWTGQAWVMNKPCEIRPPSGDQIRVNLVGGNFWNLIEYRGPGGTAKELQPIFRFWGMKESRIYGIKIRNHANYVQGFVTATGDKFQSNSNNIFDSCRFQPWEDTVGTVGFLIGYNKVRTQPNDQSCITLNRCSVEYYGPGLSQNNGQIGKLTANAKAGHTGFLWQGGNTLSSVMRDCNVSGVIGIDLVGRNGQDSGGSGLFVDNFGSSGAPVVFHVPGGFDFHVQGGRHELGGIAFVLGAFGYGNDNNSSVSIRDSMFDDFLPSAVAAEYGAPKGALMLLHADVRAQFECLRFTADGPLGETLEPDKWLSLNCSKPTATPKATFRSCVVSNRVQGAKVEVPISRTKPAAGKWTVTFDND